MSGTVTYIYMSRKILIEHPCVGLALLAQSRKISIEHPSVGARFVRPIMYVHHNVKMPRRNYVDTRMLKVSFNRPVKPLRVLFIFTIR